MTLPQIDISTMADQMESYAQHLKSRLPMEQQHIIDAILLAKEVRDQTIPTRLKIANLRGSAIRCKQQSMMLSSCMSLLADHLEKNPPTVN